MTYDHAFRGILAGALAAMVAACAHAGAAPANPSMTRIETTYGNLPVKLCLDADAATWRALRGGTLRLALHVAHQTPSRRNGPTLTVRLAGDAKTRRDVDTLSPGIDNVGESGPVPQHFLIDLAPALAQSPETPQVCVEVDVERIDAADTTLGERPVTLGADWQTVPGR
jgi:hypothetical protein